MLLFVSLAKAQDNPNKHVYDSERLQIIKDTEKVKGTVLAIYNEIDGDYHIRLRMNKNDIRLSHRNYTKQDSCIVLEIVCGHKAIFPISCTCKDYTNKVLIPDVGDKIEVSGQLVSGQLVFDKRHRWIEIHPVYYWILD